MFRQLDKNTAFPEMEKQILDLWDKDDSFQKSISMRKDAPNFVFNDGPPFATGLPHYGHLLAGTIKDIVPRFWTMEGYKVERRFGWDCHGLPIESLVQNNLKLHSVKDIRDYGVDRFNESCRENVLTYTREWRNTVRKMGRWVDFDNEYRTMDRDFMESVWWVFRQVYDKGLIYQDYRIQPYSPALATPLSNFEVNQGYQDRQDPSITVTFPLEGSDASFLVWTTTPWTLPSNLAIALHPDLVYQLVHCQEGKFWIAESRRAAYFGDGAQILESKTGRELAGKRYRPLFEYAPMESEKQYTLLNAEFVTDADGTGAVHIAPSFGEDDFILGRSLGLGLFDPLDAEGRFTEAVPEWKGTGAKDADKSIIQTLKQNGRMFRHETMVHSYPHCWRTGVPLLYRALKTWFLSLEKEITGLDGRTMTLKDWMLSSNAQINWVPGHIKTGRFGKWLEGARDWNLGRNRFWGTPIPVWQAEDGDEICIGSVAELEALTGQSVSDLHSHFVDSLEIKTKDKKTFDPGGKVFHRTEEVLDCWFESGSMPYAQSHYPFERADRFDSVFPADFIAEGLDQTRGWFYTLTVLGAALFQKPAFKNVIVNGIILAEDGQKMSKRLKNYPDPNELIDRTSADAIRLFMINSAAVKAEELKFSEAGVKEITRSVLLPLWNSLSLLVTYANADESKGQLAWKPGELLESDNQLDRWILSVLQELLSRVRSEMEAYRLYNVVPALLEFIDDLTNWYIRRSRRRFWKSENDADKNQAYSTLYHVLVEFSKVLAPFLPFLSEEMYQILVRELRPDQPESVHHCDFPKPRPDLQNQVLVEKMADVREAVLLGRALRSQHNLKNRQPLASMTLCARGEEQKAGLMEMAELIQDELNVKALEVTLHEEELVHYSAKANFKTLGNRMGKTMKNVAAQISKFSHDQVKQLLQGGTVQLAEGEIGQHDIQVVREVKKGMVVEAGKRLTVALDTEISPGLIQEMLAREAVSRIQAIRKSQDLEVTDTIRVEVRTDSEQIRTSLELHSEYVTTEVLAEAIRFVDKGGNLDAPKEHVVHHEGRSAVFNVEKV